jgi:hypothetical protein
MKRKIERKKMCMILTCLIIKLTSCVPVDGLVVVVVVGR